MTRWSILLIIIVIYLNHRAKVINIILELLFSKVNLLLVGQQIEELVKKEKMRE